MTWVKQRFPRWLDPQMGETGATPYAEKLGQRLVDAYGYLVNWYRQGQFFTFVGPRTNDANEKDGTFHVILSAPERADDGDRQLCLGLQNWQQYDTTTATQVTWTPPVGAAQTIYTHDTSSTIALNTTELPKVGPRLLRWLDTSGSAVGWAPDGTNEFLVGQVGLQEYLPKALSIWEIPERVMSATQRKFDRNDFGHNRVVGINTIRDLFDAVGDGDDHVESMERNTRRCCQWGHPKGIWIEQTTYTAIFGSPSGTDVTWKFRGRDLGTSNTTVKCRMAMIVSFDGGGARTASIKITNVNTTNTWLWTTTSTITNTLVDYTDGVPGTGLDMATAANHDFKFECKTSNASYPVKIHTVALFEGPAW